MVPGEDGFSFGHVIYLRMCGVAGQRLEDFRIEIGFKDTNCEIIKGLNVA